MFPVVVVIGFILWKYVNGSDSLDPNLDCKVGCKVFADGSSHCFASVRKLGNHRSSESAIVLKLHSASSEFETILLASPSVRALLILPYFSGYKTGFSSL